MSKESEMYMKAMYGKYAIHVPMWMVVQDQGNVSAFVGASHDLQLRYGSQLTHQLILGEMIIRPHVVVESSEFAGHGISGLLTAGLDLNDWARNGNVLVDPMGKLS